MDLPKLTAFLAVAEELHFGRAAQRLHLTSSPLSRQIAQLERELGGALFVREYHRVALTPMGEALVEPVRRVLTGVGELPSIAARARGEARPLRIAATTWAPTAVVTRFASATGCAGDGAGPDLEIFEDSEDLVTGLVEGRLDLALLHLPTQETELTVVPWLRYPLAIAVRADDPLAGRDRVALSELRDRRMVAPVLHKRFSRAGQRVTSLLENAGITPAAYVRGALGGVEVSREVLLRGMITIVPHLAENQVPSLLSPPAFATVPVEDDGFGMDIGFAWCAGRAGDTSARRQQIEAVVKELGGEPAAAGSP
ncbi:hypothetical protein PZ61_0235440 [Streptomyces sp. MNU77]|uniref:LysR family transcriptional regulator n=1 Tax=Streptomyces sp. MNU77 TaxID=1573406 RepID=UPI0005DEF5EC|nr:LysR family transcriptional regulator [Streptomyces sp. MNU77]OLO25738.1 hypothetical protein PZ61_0235440 [Streptomyces sp. MNU77]